MSVGWRAEWSIALRRRRLLTFNVVVPLLLILPLTVGAAPAPHAAAAACVLFVIFGVFGSSIPLVRDANDGLTRRWILAGVQPGGFLAGRLAAQAALDFVVLVPSAAVIVAASGRPAEVAPALSLALGLTLVVANALGAWVGAAARSLAEAALLGAVVTLLLLHGGGVFRTPPAGSWQAAVESTIPFRLLHEELLLALGGPATPGAGAPPALATALLFLLVTAALGTTLCDRLSRPRAG